MEVTKWLDKLKLTVNEEKTRICKVPEGEFDFLGFTFGRMYSATTGQARMGAYTGTFPIYWLESLSG
ncbi:hypothetical protein PQR21_30110 [Paraburkholderia nemoris]|uniref:hypothetical protein n=1 Tax=Paraburkholderia nemoris TaxID=2793076 RepID=UPI0038BC9D06